MKKWMAHPATLALGALVMVAAGQAFAETIPQLPLLDFRAVGAYGKYQWIQPEGYFAVGLRYVHPPRVEWQPVPGTARYELLLLQGGKILGVTAAQGSPCFIQSGWDKTQPGKASIVIRAFDAAGAQIALSRMFPFYVAPDFDPGVAAKRKKTYREAAMRAFDALYNLKPRSTPASRPASEILPVLLTARITNADSYSYSYPNLHDWMHVEMLVEMSKIAEGELKQKVLRYACSVGDHLLLCRLPQAGYAYGGFILGAASVDDGGGALGMKILNPKQAEKLKRLVEPGKNGYSGVALIQIHEITGEAKYLGEKDRPCVMPS